MLFKFRLLLVLSKCFNIFFFFFQAEDGIRDGHVTGVQTCALPISPEARVKPFGVAATQRVEDEQMSAGVSCGGLDRSHEHSAVTATPRGGMDEHLRDLGPMPRVG